MSFALAIKCIDGRTQIPVIEYLKENYGVKYIDLVTEAGPVQYLADQKKSNQTQSIIERAAVSVQRHYSEIIAVAAHYDCAGNPVCENTQKRQLVESVEFIKDQFADCHTIGLWSGPEWGVERVV